MSSMDVSIYGFLLYLTVTYCYNIDEENYLIFNGKPGSSFGFSSGLIRSNNKTWLLVGAPRDNFTDFPKITTPGNVYKCPMDFSTKKQTGCAEMTNLRSGEETRKNERFAYEENNQLLGANLIVKDYEIVTCSSLWKNVEHEYIINGTGVYLPLGFCYEISKSNLDFVKKKRFKELEKTLVTATGYIYGMAQVGFSTTEMKKNPDWDMVFGAPGINDGKGGFVFSKTGANSYKIYKITDNNDLRSTSRGAYAGYSIGTGNFGSLSALVVIGIPRFSNQDQGHIGAVLMLEAQDGIVNRKTFSGDQTGSGFGASLCVADINGDGNDDLLVGAPYYNFDIGKQNLFDCGKVYVYYGTGNSDYTRKQPTQPKDLNLYGMRKTMSRFGSAITNIGDINDDSYNDVAIGAPYEDDLSGAVYIYNGKEGNINNMYSQRISGQRFIPGLQSFGMHISAALDVDNNQYGDFAVGAYMSDSAVVLRTRPVVNMTAKLIISPDVIPLNSSGLSCSVDETKLCVNITLCFKFVGKGVDKILIDFDVKSDTLRTKNRKSSRLQLYLNGEKFRGHVKREKFVVRKGEFACASVVGRVESITKEFFRAISDEILVEAEYQLSNESIPGKVFPILNEKFPRKINRSAYFEKECIQKCRSNLDLKMTVIRPEVPEIIIGQTDEVAVRFEIRNKGQPSYATTINIAISNNTAFLGSQENKGSQVVKCKMADNLDVVQCDVEKPLYQHQLVNFTVRFNVTVNELLPCERCYDYLLQFIKITASAEPQGSEEVDPSDNKMSYSLPLKFMTELEISGISKPEQHKVKSDSGEDYFKFTHEYTVYNTGPSPLPATKVVIDVPVETPGKVTLIEESKLSIPRCNLISYLGELQNPQTTETTVAISPSTSVSPQVSTTTLPSKSTVEPTKRKKREAQPLEQIEKQTITNITCGNYGCAKFDCTLDHLDVKEKTSFKIETSLRKGALPFGKVLRYKTKSEVIQPSHWLFYPWNRGVLYEAYIDIFPEKVSAPTSTTNIYIIIGGCLGGIALIILSGVILWRCGFFKRKRYENLKELKRQSMRTGRCQSSSSSRSSETNKYEPQEVAKVTKSSESLNGK